jgi:hypothetical protein
MKLVFYADIATRRLTLVRYLLLDIMKKFNVIALGTEEYYGKFNRLN